MAITPMGHYEWSWLAWTGGHALRSSGGLGVTVYLNEQSQPLQSRQAVLWSPRMGVLANTTDGGTGRLADAATPGVGFGPVPIAPVFIETGPGLRYLVWVWCWLVNRIPPNMLFFARVAFQMPFVAVCAGPPSAIR